jgi:lycopene beta-cyclase
MKQYDYIIAGGGCAGLMFAYFINHSELANKKTLILDFRQKCNNDRTWCYWEKNEGIFDQIITKKWNLLEFYSQDKLIPLNIQPYFYKMIRGIDFYEFIKMDIALNPHIEWIHEKVEDINDGINEALVITDQNTYSGRYVLNSLPITTDFNSQKYNHIVQHFLGWFIETKNNSFNPERPVFMDFRVAQKDDMRFVYVLPVDSRKALVEYTIFSADIATGEEFRIELEKYIKDFLHIDEFQILDKEFGKIHLTDYPFRIRESKHVINIGSRAGMIKPSTGFAFTRIERQSEALVNALIKKGHPFYSISLLKKRYRLYDKTYLKALSNHINRGHVFLSKMFRKNNSNDIFRYLNEESSIAGEFKLFFTVDIPRFTKALIDVLIKKL